MGRRIAVVAADRNSEQSDIEPPQQDAIARQPPVSVLVNPYERALLPWESQAEFRALHAAFHAEHQPKGATEVSLVDQLAWIEWRRRRLILGERAAHMASLQERTGAANEPINRLSALLSNTQVNTPQYQTYQPQGMATTDVAGITQQGFANQQATYAQQMAQQNAMIGAAASLGAAGIKASDRRLKKDIEKVGKADGHNLYEYRYQNEDANAPKQVGVMAQEVEKTRPDAVINTPTGKMVNYPKLFGLGAGI